MEKFEIIKESALTEIKFDTLCQSKVYAVFDLDQFFVYDNGKLHSLTGHGKIDIENLLSNTQDEGTHFVAEFESLDGVLDFFSLKWKI